MAWWVRYDTLNLLVQVEVHVAFDWRIWTWTWTGHTHTHTFCRFILFFILLTHTHTHMWYTRYNPYNGNDWNIQFKKRIAHIRLPYLVQIYKLRMYIDSKDTHRFGCVFQAKIFSSNVFDVRRPNNCNRYTTYYLACLICSKFNKLIEYVCVLLLLLLCTEQLREETFFSSSYCRVRFFPHSPANACY